MSFFLLNSIYASASFSGLAGGKFDYSTNQNDKDPTSEVKLQGFFAGQFNFSSNLWAHMEFSIDTENLFTKDFFEGTPSVFQIDEISLTVRGNLNDSSNYFSTFMGTYDPIGSDIFLTRYFGLESISSKITESWLGLSGSILYPHFGIGIADIIKLKQYPFAFGFYGYFNHVDDKYYVFNADARTAFAFRYFSMDFAIGLGAPLSQSYQGENVIVAIDKLYWHAGTTILLGNNYTNGLFIQAGMFNAAFSAHSNSMIVSKEDLYLLFEPRFLFGNLHVNLSFYSMPENTIKKLQLLEDTLGFCINFYTDSVKTKIDTMSIGLQASFSLAHKSFLDIIESPEILSGNYNINIMPYFSCSLLNGEVHGALKLNANTLISENWYKAIGISLGYKTAF